MVFPTDIFGGKPPKATEEDKPSMGDRIRDQQKKDARKKRGDPVLQQWYRTEIEKRDAKWQNNNRLKLEAYWASEEKRKNSQTEIPYAGLDRHFYEKKILEQGSVIPGGEPLTSVDWSHYERKITEKVNPQMMSYYRTDPATFGRGSANTAWDETTLPKGDDGKLLNKYGESLPGQASGWQYDGETPYYGNDSLAPMRKYSDNLDAIDAEIREEIKVQAALAEELGEDYDADKEYVLAYSTKQFGIGEGSYGQAKFALGYDYATTGIGKLMQRLYMPTNLAFQLIAETGDPLLWQKTEQNREEAELLFEQEHGFMPPSKAFREEKLKDHWLYDYFDRIQPQKFYGNMFLSLVRLARGDVKLSEVPEYRARSKELSRFAYSLAYRDTDAIKEFEDRVTGGQNPDLVALSMEQPFSQALGYTLINPTIVVGPISRMIKGKLVINSAYKYINSPADEVAAVYKKYGNVIFTKTGTGTADYMLLNQASEIIGEGAVVTGSQAALPGAVATATTEATAAASEAAWITAAQSLPGQSILPTGEIAWSNEILAGYSAASARHLAGMNKDLTSFGMWFTDGASKQHNALVGAKLNLQILNQNLKNADDVTDALVNMARLNSLDEVEQRVGWLNLNSMLHAPELALTDPAIDTSIYLKELLSDEDGTINPVKFKNRMEKAIEAGTDPVDFAINEANKIIKRIYATKRQIIDTENALKLDPTAKVPVAVQRFWDQGGKLGPFQRMIAMTTAEKGLAGKYGAAHRLQKNVSSTVLVGMNFPVATRGALTDLLTSAAVQPSSQLYTGFGWAEIGGKWIGFEHPGYLQGFGGSEITAINKDVSKATGGSYETMGSLLNAVVGGNADIDLIEKVTNFSGRSMVFIEQKNGQKIIGSAIQEAMRDLISKTMPDSAEMLAAGVPEEVVRNFYQLLINHYGDADKAGAQIIERVSNGEPLRTKDLMEWMDDQTKQELRRIGVLQEVEQIAVNASTWEEAEQQIDALLEAQLSLIQDIEGQFPAPQRDPINLEDDIGHILEDAHVARNDAPVSIKIDGEKTEVYNLPLDIYNTGINRIQANVNVTDRISHGIIEIKEYINEAVRHTSPNLATANTVLDGLKPIYKALGNPKDKFIEVTGESREAMAYARDFGKRLLKLKLEELPGIWAEIQSRLSVPGDIPEDQWLAKDRMWTYVFADYIKKFSDARKIAVVEFQAWVDGIVEALPDSPIRDSIYNLAEYKAVLANERVATGLDNAVIYDGKLRPIQSLVQGHAGMNDSANAARAISAYLNPYIEIFRVDNTAFDGEILDVIKKYSGVSYNSIDEVDPQVAFESYVKLGIENEFPVPEESYDEIIGYKLEVRVPEAVPAQNIVRRAKTYKGDLDLTDSRELRKFIVRYGEIDKITPLIEESGSVIEQNIALTEYAQELINGMRDKTEELVLGKIETAGEKIYTSEGTGESGALPEAPQPTETVAGIIPNRYPKSPDEIREIIDAGIPIEDITEKSVENALFLAPDGTLLYGKNHSGAMSRWSKFGYKGDVSEAPKFLEDTGFGLTFVRKSAGAGRHVYSVTMVHQPTQAQIDSMKKVIETLGGEEKAGISLQVVSDIVGEGATIRNLEELVPSIADDIEPIIPPHDGSLAVSEGRNIYEQRDILEAAIRKVKTSLEPVWTDTTPNIPKKSLKPIKAFLKEVKKRMVHIKNAAAQYGQAQRDRILHDYANRFGMDGALGMVRNFHFWPTRTLYQWAKRAPYYLDLIQAYMNYREAMDKHHASWPEWLRQSWSTNEIFGLDAENPLYLSLAGILDVFENLGGGFEDEDRRATWFSSIVDQLSNKIPGSMGMIQQYAMAIGLKAAGEDEAAAKWGGRMIPVTNTIKGLTSIVGVNEGRGIDLDPSVGYFSANNDWDSFVSGRSLGPYDEKRVAVALGYLIDKYPDIPEELLEQAKKHQGPLWDEAVGIVANQGAYGNVVSFFTGINARARSRDDLVANQFWSEYISLVVRMDDYDKDEWKIERQKLMDKYPFAETMLLGRKGTEERNIAYGYSVLSRIAPGETDDISKAAGFKYDIISYFYDNNGDISELPQNDQDKLMTFFAEVGATIAIPDKATKGEWMEAGIRYSEMLEEGQKMFGETIWDKVDAGYNLKGESLNSQDAWYDYLEEHPEVNEAMSWKAGYIINDKVLSPYYGSIDRLRNFWKGIMYQKLEDEFGSEIWDIQTQYFIYTDTGQKDEAKAWKKKYPQLQNYWDKKNDVYIPDLTQAMVDYGEKLPEGQDTRLRDDWGLDVASTGEVDIAGYIEAPDTKSYTRDEWVGILKSKETEMVLLAWELGDEFPKDLLPHVQDMAAELGMSYDELVLSVGTSR